MRKEYAHAHSYKDILRKRWVPDLSHASAYERANLKVQWNGVQRGKKYFRFALVALARTIQQPRDTSSKVCSIRKSALQISLGSSSSTLFLTLSLFLAPVFGSLYRPSVRVVQLFSDKQNAICVLSRICVFTITRYHQRKSFVKLLNCYKSLTLRKFCNNVLLQISSHVTEKRSRCGCYMQ